SGVLAFAGNNEYDPSVGGGCIDLSNQKEQSIILEKDDTQKTSEMVKEKLVATGSIDKIETTEEGTVITVDGNKILVHESTNIFKVESLIGAKDLEEGQIVEVYSDGVQGDILNGLKVEVLMTCVTN
ncbi:MAG: hypothetical protein ACRDB0_04195, partial [Paraclostridium sp.]